MPRNTDNADRYDFEWLTVYKNGKLVGSISVSIDRSGSGVLYVREIPTSGSEKDLTIQPNTGTDTSGTASSAFSGLIYYYDDIDGNGSLIVVGGTDTLGNDYVNYIDNTGSLTTSYGTVSNFVPEDVTQTTTYVDDSGNTIASSVVQTGWTGQVYTTSSGEVITGYYSDDTNDNGNGTMSQFGDIGAQYEKNYHNGVSVIYTQTGSDGTMSVTVYNNGTVVYQDDDLGPGATTSTKVGNTTYYIVNPYVQQTENIQYQYLKLGSLIVEDSDGNIISETQYANDPTNASDAYYPTTDASGQTLVPSEAGYDITATDSDGNSVDVSDIQDGLVPSNLGEDTIVIYTPNASTSESVSGSESTSASESTSESVSGSESTSASESTSESVSG
ncbi:hypothetical protein R5Q06_05690, partial [Oenococcus oeni]